MKMSTRRWQFLGIASGILLGLILIFVLIIIFHNHSPQKKPIKVGVLFSLTGSLALTETSLAEVTLLAIDEINRQGGVNGQHIIPVVADGKSDEGEFVKQAEKLIRDDKVAAIFGIWESPMRKGVTPVVEKYNNFLFYPAHDEGLTESENVIYTGSMPNQTVFPAVWWMYNHLGKTFFLVGSNDIFAHSVFDMIKMYIALLGGTVLGEEYVHHNEQQIPPIIEKIIASKPQVIINGIDPDDNIFFIKQLRAAGITPEKIPSLMLSLSENELSYIDQLDAVVDDYAAWTYFQALYRPENTRFIALFQHAYGKKRVLTANMESAYASVYLWANAVNEAKTTDTDTVRPYLKKQVFDAPGGILYLDDTLHTWRNVYIGKIMYNGQFEIVWSSQKQIKPLIYPPFKDKKYWDDFVHNLYKKFGGKWSSPL